ncbi:MAG: exopolysaccharide biosynthesis polyprenyl glycosylphosphotransferase [Candidatus Nanopelagicales bacterium]|nr:exopolysaccharide biosynthesis polyprenyl glycosylphosphotransferase [Candidatus Nanopelagicales bacterium]
MALSDDLGSPKAGEPTNGGPSAPSNSPQGAAYPTLSSASHRDKPHLRRDPLRVYATRAVVWDMLAVMAASAIGFILRWTIPYNLDISDSTYVFFALVVVVSWVSVLVLRGAYDTRILGVGSEEFKRIVGASAMVFGAIAIVSFALKLDLSRGFVLITFTVGMLMLLTVRWILRAWLRHERMYGHFLHRTIVVGSGSAQSEIVDMLDRDPVAGFTVVDVVDEPPDDVTDQALDQWLDEVMTRISLEDADTVAVAGSRALEQTVIQRLAWRLEGPRVDLLVAPNIGDVAGPRVTMRMAADLPLLHLDEPHLTGPKRAIKRTLDVVFGLLFFLLFMPFMVVAAVGTFASSRGPVFYKQQRVGRGGDMITVTKFRTMYAGADQQRDEVIGTPDAEIFDRYKSDPRITPFGRILRRWSIDEMPQVVNVIRGNMSLVGPRPVLPEELGLFDDADHRRHLTKPGLTGLWQVSGRKEVDWDERMRMDLDYVENWSPALDLVIVAKTAKVVLSGRGAY